MKTKISAYSISPALQRVFVYSALAAFIIPVGSQIYMAAVQYSSNPNLSAYYLVMIYMLVAPIAFFKIAYLISDRKKPRSARIFVSTFMAAVGMMILTALSTLASHLMISISLMFSDVFWDWLTFEIGSLVTVVGLYTVLLLVLKRKGAF